MKGTRRRKKGDESRERRKREGGRDRGTGEHCGRGLGDWRVIYSCLWPEREKGREEKE